ncbi:MAG: UDP-3-O-(3-hydroxymyristoyl)glucosamine N-acyltransferase [Acidiferrobacterales bacterium]
MDYDLAQLASHCDGRVKGDGTKKVCSVASIDTAGPEHLTYLTDKKYGHFLENTAAGVVLLDEEASEKYDGDAIVVANPHLAFAILAKILTRPRDVTPSIHPSAQISPEAKVSNSAWIGPNVVIEKNATVGSGSRIGAGSFVGQSARIGDGTVLYPGVTINEYCVTGQECIFLSGAVIGSRGFGYVIDENHRWIGMPQLGRVIIGDRVEIGANTTIDRGALKDTEIHNGVKIDNLVHIAHNVIVGENTAIAACTGIAGSAIIGKRCSISGQVSIFGHIELTDDVVIAATSLVRRTISEPGIYSSSLPVVGLKLWLKNVARIYQLDKMARRLGQIEKIIKKL